MSADPSTDVFRMLSVLASQGIPVLPVHQSRNGVCTCSNRATCKSPGKHPRLRNGVKGATKDASKIRQWLNRPGYLTKCNWAVRTGRESGLVIVDIDHRSGGAQTFAELLKQFPIVEQTVRVDTGNGLHLWFRHPGGVVKNRTGARPGLDLKANDGYALVPPSLHPNGVTYVWRRSLEDKQIAHLPPELLEYINSPALTTSVVNVQVGAAQRSVASVPDESKAESSGNRPCGREEVSENEAEELRSFVRGRVPAAVLPGTRNRLACDLGRTLHFSQFASYPVGVLRDVFEYHYDLICARVSKDVEASRSEHVGECEYMFVNAHTPVEGVLEKVETEFMELRSSGHRPPELKRLAAELHLRDDDWCGDLLLLCWCFHSVSHGRVWFASYRKLGELLRKAGGLELHPERIRRAMHQFQRRGILEKVRNGTSTERDGRATEWRWCPLSV